MKNSKRILAVFLAAVLSISILPAGTLASETSENEVTESSDEAYSQADAEQEAGTTAENASEEAAAEDSSETAEPADEEAEPADEEAEPADEEAEPAAEEAEPAGEEDPAAAENTAQEDAEADRSAEESEEIIPEEENAAQEEVPAETVEWPVTLEAGGEDYVVTASFSESAGFPADVQMKVSEVEKIADEYQDYYDKALDAVQKETDRNVEFFYARFFDIAFYTKEGEVEPAVPSM